MPDLPLFSDGLLFSPNPRKHRSKRPRAWQSHTPYGSIGGRLKKSKAA
ncbi:TPA: hypothetical protein ACFP4Y_000585 [Neisseria bacilliformis]|nr:hypothetical protein [Neisseria bacilliformis]